MTDTDLLFEDFVRRRDTALARTAFLITGDRHRAEDVLQSALAATSTRESTPWATCTTSMRTCAGPS